MNTITRLFSLAVLLLSFTGIFGQDRPISLTANAGATVSDMDVETIKANPQFGYKIGVGVEYNLPKNTFLQTELELVTKGAKLKWEENGDIDGNNIPGDYSAVTEKVELTYLVLPLMGGYRLPISNSIRMNLSAGPYFAYGISGKAKRNSKGYIMEDNGTTTPFDIDNKDNSFTKDRFNRFDMGIAANVGTEYNRIILNLGYELGLLNYSRSDLSAYNTNLYLTLGYRIF